MTREELKEHCKRQIQQFERIEKKMPITPNDWKRYEEHKLILELLEQEPILDKIRAEILDNAFSVVNPHNTYEYINVIDLDSIDDILDKYKAESEG